MTNLLLYLSIGMLLFVVVCLGIACYFYRKGCTIYEESSERFRQQYFKTLGEAHALFSENMELRTRVRELEAKGRG